MKFKKNEFLKLLCERKRFEDAGQSINDFNKEKNQKLNTYWSLLDDHNFWENRSDYIQILDDFVHNKIIFDQFTKQFYNLRASNLRSQRRIEVNLEEILSTNFEVDDINIEYNPKSYGFTKLISKLQASIDICDPKISFEANLESPEQIIYGLSEKSLKLEIENFFLPEMKKY